jgi:hypothetical protein
LGWCVFGWGFRLLQDQAGSGAFGSWGVNKVLRMLPVVMIVTCQTIAAGVSTNIIRLLFRYCIMQKSDILGRGIWGKDGVN